MPDYNEYKQECLSKGYADFGKIKEFMEASIKNEMNFNEKNEDEAIRITVLKCPVDVQR